jgi:hypothetical protein
VRNATLTSALLVALLSGCRERTDQTALERADRAASAEPAPSVAPAQQRAPELELDIVSAKVGFERALLQNPEGRARLGELLAGAKKWIEGQEVRVVVDRKAKVSWVATYLDELGKLGPSAIILRTDTRKDYGAEQRFVPESKVDAPPCSLVAMVTSDFGTAVWRLSGGVASKRARGMAGPDLSMTGETVERLAKGCSESTTFFVAVADGVDWGLAFDLAASSRVLDKARFEQAVLLGQAPTPGHKVQLKR